MALLAFRPRSFLRAFFAFLLVWPLLVQPVMAQSILRDAETEALFHDISLPLIKAAGLDPRNVRIVLIGDKSSATDKIVPHPHLAEILSLYFI